MENYTKFQQYPKVKSTNEDDHYEEEQDVLSLSDFPITSSYKIQEHRRSSSEPISDHHVFEFFNATSSDTIIMSHAEDLIFGGKLLPYKNLQLPPSFDHIQTLKSLSANDASDISRKYQRSSSRLNPATSNGARPFGCESVMKSEPLDIRSSKGPVKCERLKVSKRRWSVLMFGPMRLELTDLGDMRNRQLRRCTWSIFPAGDHRSNHRRSSWVHDLLGVLSCQTHASLAVTASIGGGVVPHV